MSSSIVEHMVPCGAPSTSTTEAPLSPITLWQMGSIPSVHVLPGSINVERFKDAIASTSSLYPVIGGRLRRRQVKEAYEYYVSELAKPLCRIKANRPRAKIELNQSPIKVTVETSDGSEPPFATPAVIQPSLHNFVDNLNPATQLNIPESPLISFKITQLPVSGTSVLGFCWAHILGDGDAFSTFSRTLSRLYAGAGLAQIVPPTFSPHVALLKPTSVMLGKWEIPQLFPSFTLPVGSALCESLAFFRP